jgi:hypothetical protein
MKNVVIVAMVIIATTTSGCTGIEIGGKAWISRVDEKQESQRTYRDNSVPLKCYFVDCAQKTSDEVQGS